MEMNDILNGLNSCGSDNCSDSIPGNELNTAPAGIFPSPICGGCGINAWIWILLILFYCGCGNGGVLGGNNNVCCCNDDCCCCTRNNSGVLGSGLLGNSCVYLFLLVILFLCNRWNSYAPYSGAGLAAPYGAGLANIAY